MRKNVQCRESEKRLIQLKYQSANRERRRYNCGQSCTAKNEGQVDGKLGPPPSQSETSTTRHDHFSYIPSAIVSPTTRVDTKPPADRVSKSRTVNIYAASRTASCRRAFLLPLSARRNVLQVYGST